MINKKFENVTLTSEVIWVVIDVTAVRVGFSSIVSPATQALAFEMTSSSAAAALKYVRVDLALTYNIALAFMQSHVIATKVDFSVLSSMKRTHNEVVRHSSYTNGEMCPSIKGPRSATVEFRCGDSFFQIISVTEPSICKYSVIAETNLLCAK